MEFQGNDLLHLQICAVVVYWCCTIALFFKLLPWIMMRCSVLQRRKCFHLLAIALFLPPTVKLPVFMGIGYLVAFVGFVALEFVRLQCWSIGKRLAFISALLKKEESLEKPLLCHIELLLGCAIPLWISLLSNPHTLTRERDKLFECGGIVCVGVGDSLAALIGNAFGSIRMVGGKTLEGTLAFALGSSLAFKLSFGSFELDSCLAAALSEAFCSRHDNFWCSLVFSLVYLSKKDRV